jgi:hypothetical protein
MPQVVYAQATHGGLTLTISGPSIFVPGVFAPLLAARLGGVGLNTAGYLVRLSQDAYHDGAMATRWTPQSQIGPGLTVFAGVSTDDPVLPFLEWDVQGHWMPWGPGSAFARWAERVGVRNVYLAARSYAGSAHPGRHLMPKVLAQAAQLFTADLVAAVNEALSQ